jgi:hypothetical protein
MSSSLLKAVFVTEFQTTEAHSDLNLTKPKYSMSNMRIVEKEIRIVN